MAANKKTYWLLLKAQPKNEDGQIRFVALLVKNKVMVWQCNCDISQKKATGLGADFVTETLHNFAKNCKDVLIRKMPKKRKWDYISAEPSFQLQLSQIAPEVDPANMEKFFITLLKN